MKLYEKEPELLIRLSINKNKVKPEYLTLCETNFEEALDFIKGIVIENATPIAEGKKTSVVVREALGGKNGKSKSVGFYGLEPKEMRDLIIQKLK